MVAIGGIADIVQHWHEMAGSRMKADVVGSQIWSDARGSVPIH